MALTEVGNRERITPSLNDVIDKYGDHDPKGNAEILYKYRQIMLNESNEDEVVTYLAIRINKEEAIPYYSQFELSFDEYYESLNLDFARVKTQSGSILDLPKSAVQIKTANEALFYNEHKNLTFSVPKLLPGSIIEFQYRRKTLNQAIPKQWFHTEALSWHQRNPSTGEYSFDAVNVSEVQVLAPIENKIFLHGQKAELINQNSYIKDDRQVIEISRHNISKMIPQEMMPSYWITRPSLIFTTVASWQDLSQSSYQVFESGIESSDLEEIKVLANEITNGLKTKQQKLQAIFSYVQNNIRYVYAHLGRGGLTPHSPNWTLENGFGDCKDQSALLISLLNAVDIKATPALYHSSGRYLLKSAPRLMFDHMIVYVPQQSGLTAGFIDTSNYKLQFPGIAPINNMAQALVLGDGQGKFINLSVDTQPNTLSVSTDYHSITNDKVSAEITLSAKGYYDDYFRSIWLQSQEREKSIRGIIKSLFTNASIISLKVENEKDLFKPVVITTQIEFPINSRLENGLLFGASYKQVAQTFMPVGPFEDNIERRHDLYNGMSLRITHVTRVSSDRELYANLIKQPIAIDTPFLKMSSHTVEGDDMALRMEIIIEPFTLAVDEYESFKTPFIDGMENGNWLIQVKPGKLNSTSQLIDIKQEGNITNIKNLIDRGEYEKALAKVNTLLDKNENPEGYFFKGLVLGFLNQHEESDAAFEKAELLGYEI